MSEPKAPLSTRDRALAELVRLRGWAGEEPIQRAIAEVSDSGGARDLGSILVTSGLITPAQLRDLEAAMDGRGSGGSDRTVARSDPGATLAAAGRKVGDTVGPYRILRELGRGGMGVVYRALHPELRREVALKVMLAGGDASETDVERFRREAAVVARMGRHPHLVQIHDIGRDGDRMYFTMDFIEGRSLRHRVAEEGPLPGREAARIAAELAGALAFAHAAGVVHRDVKPANVLLDREGRSFLGDFGLARDLSSPAALTMSGAPIGTPAYMSPEQAEGRASRVTPLTDVYSLGATLYEMLAGRAPFEGESQMDIMRSVLESEPAAPRTVRPDIHRDLEVICLKAMHKSPARRYASAADLEADLRRFLQNEPILARPAGFGETLMIRARRHRLALAAAACVLAAGAGFGGWAAWKVRTGAAAAKATSDDLERRRQAASPLVIDGVAFLERWDEARKQGNWRDRDRNAARAAEILSRAAEVNPENDEIHFQLGRALRRSGRTKEALKSLERAVEINPKHGLAWFEHGQILQNLVQDIRGRVVRSANLVLQTEQGFMPSGLNRSAFLRKEGLQTDPAPYIRQASEDFRRVLESGAAADRAAYGRAMLASFDGRFDDALREFDASVAANPYFWEALYARADVAEYAARAVEAGLADREALCRLEPHNPWLALDHALSLSVMGRQREAREIALKAVAASDAPDVLANAVGICLAAGDGASSLDIATRLASSEDAGPAHRQAGATYAVYVCLAARDFEQAGRLIESRAAILGEDTCAGLRAEMALMQGDLARATREYRKLDPGGIHARIAALGSAYAEWWCGNLDRARRQAELGAAERIVPAAPVIRGIVLMEQGLLDEALADFEAVRREEPALNITYSNLAAARFLKGDYPGAIAALEEAVTTTLAAPAQKEGVKRFFAPLAKRASEAKTPAEAARVVEGIAGLLLIAGTQATDDLQRAGVREGQRGVLYILQAFYIRHEMWKEAIGAGERIGKIVVCGGALYKDAVARARAGRKAGDVLKALAAAIEAGFDDGSRLDGEEAFDAVRGEAEYAELRAKCR
ncbi:MAG: protein kinase [Planctomycetia bacterium]|nr:protein kinase [Planctomycetia bacterium]